MTAGLILQSKGEVTCSFPVKKRHNKDYLISVECFLHFNDIDFTVFFQF